MQNLHTSPAFNAFGRPARNARYHSTLLAMTWYSRQKSVTTGWVPGFTTDYHEQQLSVYFHTIYKITKPHSWKHLQLSARRAIAEQSVIGLKGVQSHQV